jgi:hypothetical protein
LLAGISADEISTITISLMTKLPDPQGSRLSAQSRHLYYASV